ncbi:peptide ABC transporter substrate-binding protein [Exiguobacterium sp. MER 193]|uniref:peptide ABC transporter substrate-binding protein n=1 Tax=Exiguobacterium sp. MER 193 TaxID=2939564 RepID=UPI00203B67F3|nr:peptide ABC transporter substrate-binding protein [Exiguobacterium sp. MER 193]MCM3281250.1 peptide ABC transporter substrate-binding protein [Exiguobacterium sp. MER 193]
MKKKSILLMMTIILALGSVLAACSTGGDSDGGGSSSNGEKVLRLTDTSDITTADPALATDAVAFNLIANTMEGLYRLDKDGNAVPALAEGEPEVNEDETVYTFKLRDAEWSNGEPVTANDFVYAWQRAVDPATGSQYAYIMNTVKNAEAINTGDTPKEELGVKAIDEKTLEVTLERPDPSFLSLTSFGTFTPINEAFATEKGEDFATGPENLLYNGPFTWTKWDREQGYVLTKNESYWDAENVALDAVDVKVVKETSTVVNLYEAGDVDYAGLASEQVAAFQEDEDYNTGLRSAIGYFKFNHEDELFSDVNARKAIARAVDPSGIIDQLLNNGSVATTSFIPKDFIKYEDGTDYTEGVEYFKTDAAEAASLWGKVTGGKATTIELLSFDSEVSKQISEYMKGQIESNLPNVTVEIAQQPFNNKLEREAKGDYQMSFALWGPDYQDPLTNLGIFTSDNGQNDINYSSAEYDKLIEKASAETNIDARYDLFKEAEALLIEQDQAIMPIYQAGVAYLIRPNIENFNRQLFGADYQYKYVDIK